MLHAKGEGVKEAPAAAVGWFEAAALWGYEPSMVSLADCLVGSVPGINVDIGKATWWLRFCSDRGFPPAMLRLAECYERGLGFKADQGKARELLAAAAAAGADIPPEKLALYQREEDWGLQSGDIRDIPGFDGRVAVLSESSVGGAFAGATGSEEAGSPRDNGAAQAVSARVRR